jgi:glycosyltransferase involved in cell wall biosynthesis
VIPVYNEQDALESAVLDWTAALDAAAIDYELLLYDDGSSDATPQRAAALAERLPRLSLRRHPNRGHGPTILRGYREARGAWVFQADSDGEIAPAHFAELWRRRDGFDLLVGARAGRRSSAVRRLVSGLSRAVVRAGFGDGPVRDVNSPFRLYRREPLQRMLALMPDGLFAPNVVLTGLAARLRLRCCELAVPHRGRAAGSGSLGSLRLWRGCARALRETVALARRTRGAGG